MEAVVTPDPAFWAGRRVFLTGHTGFKGAWLWLWLRRLGAVPTGFAMAPEPGPSLWAEIDDGDPAALTGDIRDAEALNRAMQAAEPEIVLHLAAQALVRRSYAEPVETITTNVLGTVNVLEAVRKTPSVNALVSVTTDKVYLNREWEWPYRENEALGGHDPYSASKACAEIISNAWRQSFLAERGIQIATARAGNVIGGGDWSSDRLLPDCLAALMRKETIRIRNPLATRPWQHVLEPLSGYLLLAETLAGGGGAAEAWNFGPDPADVRPVSWIADRMIERWGQGAKWEHVGDGPHEAQLLAVDTSKAAHRLGWRPRLTLSDALDWTIEWVRRYSEGAVAATIVLDQIKTYEESANGPVPHATKES